MTHRIGPEKRARAAAAWPDILQQLATGATVLDACKAHGLERGHLWAYRADNPDLRQQWNDAMRDSADALFDEALDTARNSQLDSRHARNKCNVLQWAAEKRDPDRYAPRSRHDLTVRTLDLSPILLRAEQRLALARTVEGVVIGAPALPDALR
ncbi:MAG: hypothetical protein E4H01_05915 [Lysobacterales bacterium]|nr:MAG: hypothetical protein E4H01_05915 [Xanthomonadales bacterium]